MNDERHIVTLTVQQLQDAILASLKDEVQKMLGHQNSAPSEDIEYALLTRQEVAKIFSISTVSLDKWKRAGLLPRPVKMAGRVYFLRKEIIEMIKNRRLK